MKKTTRELKKEVCAALNIKHAHVSVTGSAYSTDCRIDCIGKLVSLDKAREIVGQVESIARCEYTGEILSGGNHFVHASYRKVDDNAKTLLWSILELAFERCPTNMDYRNYRYFTTKACLKIAQEMPELEVAELTVSDWANLLDFGDHTPGSKLWKASR